jgi:hypothetical protein
MRLFAMIFSAMAFALSMGAQAQMPAVGCSSWEHATDRNVFNWRFYLNHNADLNIAGIRTPAAACAHWLSNGRYEGRQAHAGFHSEQYLARYPDLTAAFGSTNYTAAIWHYVVYGMAEQRVGYLENGLALGFKRSTVQSSYAGSKLFVSAGARTAGAVDSVMIDNTELINSFDHGRQVQVALVRVGDALNPRPAGECYNPNEAGANFDYTGYGTTSRLDSSSASVATMSTLSTPAFWMAPALNCYVPQTQGVRAEAYRFDKTVQAGYPFANVVRFAMAFQVNEPVSLGAPAGQPYQSVTVEIPTAYMAGDLLNVARKVDPATGAVTDINAAANDCAIYQVSCNHSQPVIFTDASQDLALGACSGPIAGSGGNFVPPVYRAYGELEWNVPAQDRSPLSSTTKWAIWSTNLDAISPPKTFTFTSYVVVGKRTSVSALQEAASTIKTLFDLGYCQ